MNTLSHGKDPSPTFVPQAPSPQGRGREPHCLHAPSPRGEGGLRSGPGEGSRSLNSAPPLVSVQEGYTRWAPTYDQDPNPLLALEERCLRPLLPRFAGKRILDLACGTGRWSTWLLAQGADSVVGVDLSSAMLAMANKKLGLQGRLVASDCRELPFPCEVFDLVLCSFALAHIQDVARVAREVDRVTTASADVFVSDLHPRAYAEGWKTAFRDQQGPVEIATWPRSRESLLADWTSAGFRCAESMSWRLDECERAILAKAGRAHLFEQVRNVPAIQISHFTRLPGRHARC